jgi:hypothetical protein
MTEVWKPVPGFGGFYEASTEGRIRSIDRVIRKMSRWGHPVELRLRGRVLKPRVDGAGYLLVQPCGGSGREPTNVHRMVAAAFHGVPVERLDVNHIDGDRLNNRPENLEWCTRAENMAHAMRTGLLRLEKPIVGTPVAGGEPIRFPSEKAAAAHLGVKRGNISSAALGRLKTAHGYRWQYENQAA